MGRFFKSQQLGMFLGYYKYGFEMNVHLEAIETWILPVEESQLVVSLLLFQVA